MKKPPTRRGDLRYWIVIVGLLVMKPTPGLFLAGSIAIVVGAAIHLWAKGCLRQDRELTTRGPYAFVRHPFYLANALIDGGILMLAANLWMAAAVVPLWAWIYARTIRREDARMRELFGSLAVLYQRCVPAFVPWRGRAWPSTGGYDARNPNIDGGREVPRVLRILAYPPLYYTVWALPWPDPVVTGTLLLFHAVAFSMLLRRRLRKRSNLLVSPHPDVP